MAVLRDVTYQKELLNRTLLSVNQYIEINCLLRYQLWEGQKEK